MSCFTGTLKSVTLQKSGFDDWRCDWVKITCDGKTCVFEFGGDKTKKAPVTVTDFFFV